MAKVVKRADLSKKDYRVDTGVLRVKDAAYNIVSNIGDGSMAEFNEINPLLYWPAPSNPKTNAVANVLFSDGVGYYTFNGTIWVFNYFAPSSSFILTSPLTFVGLFTQVDDGTVTQLNTGNTYALNGIVWTFGTSPNWYTGTKAGAFPDPDKVFVTSDLMADEIFYEIVGTDEIRIQSGGLSAVEGKVKIEVYP